MGFRNGNAIQKRRAILEILHYDVLFQFVKEQIDFLFQTDW